MVEIINHLYVGGDQDFDKAAEHGFAICSCCKEGPNGHRSVLEYTTLGAPKGKNYYFVERGKHLALNLIDSDDPNFIPKQAILPALDFIHKHLHAGDNVLVHCNAGRSRGPTTTLMFLRSIGEMPYNFVQAEKIYRTLYPKYDPGQGMRQFARSHWSELNATE